MNKGQNARRGRARNTSKKTINKSNGPGNKVDSKSRGNPKQNLEKYLGMAKDARQAGDRVGEEYYLQFAEHFQRVINDRLANEEIRRERAAQRQNQRPHQPKQDVKPETGDQPNLAENQAEESKINSEPLNKLDGGAEGEKDESSPQPVGLVEDEPKPKRRVVRRKKVLKPIETPEAEKPTPSISQEDSAG